MNAQDFRVELSVEPARQLLVLKEHGIVEGPEVHVPLDPGQSLGLAVMLVRTALLADPRLLPDARAAMGLELRRVADAVADAAALMAPVTETRQ